MISLGIGSYVTALAQNGTNTSLRCRKTSIINTFRCGILLRIYGRQKFGSMTTTLVTSHPGRACLYNSRFLNPYQQCRSTRGSIVHYSQCNTSITKCSLSNGTGMPRSWSTVSCLSLWTLRWTQPRCGDSCTWVSLALFDFTGSCKYVGCGCEVMLDCTWNHNSVVSDTTFFGCVHGCHVRSTYNKSNIKRVIQG